MSGGQVRITFGCRTSLGVLHTPTVTKGKKITGVGVAYAKGAPEPGLDTTHVRPRI